MKKIINMKEEYDCSEPEPCHRMGCGEKLNGLYHFWISMSNGFTLDTWLCENCAKEFRMVLTDDLP
jgi:hypothetical protein